MSSTRRFWVAHRPAFRSRAPPLCSLWDSRWCSGYFAGDARSVLYDGPVAARRTALAGVALGLCGAMLAATRDAAERVPFAHLGSEQGLSQNTVRCMFQDLSLIHIS